jgi:putative heme degradation protein
MPHTNLEYLKQNWLHPQLGLIQSRLKEDWANLIIACKSLGKVMALTRNEGCVLEHKGNFQKIDLNGAGPQSGGNSDWSY